MNEENFHSYSEYYNALYNDKHYHEEADFVENTLKSLNPNVGRILELGSGTGRHGCLLAERGFRVHGVELSPSMVGAAHKHPGFTCEVGDARNVVLDEKFDAVISLFHVFSYQCENIDALSFLRTASRHLEIGGIFYFDFWYGPAVLSEKPSVRHKEFRGENLVINRIGIPTSRPNDNCVDVNFTVIVSDQKGNHTRIVRERHPMRYFTLPEIDLLSEMTGFKRVFSSEMPSGKPPSEATWAVGVALEKVSA